MRAYLSSAAVLLCGAVLWLLLLQRGLTRIGLAQCACTNAECSSVLATIGTRMSRISQQHGLASCNTLGMALVLHFYEVLAILGLYKRIGDPFRHCERCNRGRTA